MKKKFLEVVLFFIGIMCLSYPILSNYINSYSKTEVIQHYVEDVENLSNDEKNNELVKAKEYNDNLNKDSGINISLDNEYNDNSEYGNYLNILNIGNVLAYISIPKINVYLPIYHGVSESVLQNGIGHMPETSFPIGGKGTHCVLAGHTGLAKATMFDYIDELVLGDKFYIYVLDIVLEYEVDDIIVVEPSYQHAIDRNENDDFITLVTCTPRYINSNRLLVRGKRVENSDAEKNFVSDDIMDNIKEDTIKKRKKLFNGITVLFIIMLFGIAFLLKGKSKKGKHSN